MLKQKKEEEDKLLKLLGQLKTSGESGLAQPARHQKHFSFPQLL